MKIKTGLLLLLAAVSISCASRPRSVITPPGTIPAPGPGSEPYEYALWNIKMNTSLVKKDFDAGEVDLTGIGVDAPDKILLKGKYEIDENEFLVTYDLAHSVKTDQNQFQIPFKLENPENGASWVNELIWSPGEDKAGLLLSFDDYFWRVWREYFQMFDNYGAKVTFFVIGSGTPPDEGDPSFQLSDITDFYDEALKRGHDMGFHTQNHLDLRQVSSETFYSETITSEEAFSESGIEFSSLAFPYGFSAPWMLEILAPFYPITRGYGSNIRIYSADTINREYITSTAIDNILYPDDGEFEDDIRFLLFAVKFSGSSIIPFTTHDFSDTADWGIKPDRLKFMLKISKELKLNFNTYKDIYRLFPRN
jgi:peptidoglycan/xylan/chitin deacetylase (PgdA/CDA1 family)